MNEDVDNGIKFVSTSHYDPCLPLEEASVWGHVHLLN